MEQCQSFGAFLASAFRSVYGVFRDSLAGQGSGVMAQGHWCPGAWGTCNPQIEAELRRGVCLPWPRAVWWLGFAGCSARVAKCRLSASASMQERTASGDYDASYDAGGL